MTIASEQKKTRRLSDDEMQVPALRKFAETYGREFDLQVPSPDEAVSLALSEAANMTEVAAMAFVRVAQQAGGEMPLRDAAVAVRYLEPEDRDRMLKAFRWDDGYTSLTAEGPALAALFKRRRESVAAALPGDAVRLMLAAAVEAGRLAVTAEAADMRRVVVSATALRGGVLDAIEQTLLVNAAGQPTAYRALQVVATQVGATHSDTAQTAPAATAKTVFAPRSRTYLLLEKRAEKFFTGPVARILRDLGEEVIEPYRITKRDNADIRARLDEGKNWMSGSYVLKIKWPKRRFWEEMTPEERRTCGWSNKDEEKAFKAFDRSVTGGHARRQSG